MTKKLVMDDWAGNKFKNYAPILAGGVVACLDRLGQGDGINDMGEAGGKGDTLYPIHHVDNKAAGLQVGTYWAIDPLRPWKSQIDWVSANWNPEMDDLSPFWIDNELTRGKTGPAIVDCVGNFVGAFEDRFNEKPGFYSRKTWWEPTMRDAYGLMPLWQVEYEFWLAQYPWKATQNLVTDWLALRNYYPGGMTTNIDPPRTNMKMKPVVGWQWAGGPILPGIDGPIDLSWFEDTWLSAHTRNKVVKPVLDYNQKTDLMWAEFVKTHPQYLES